PTQATNRVGSQAAGLAEPVGVQHHAALRSAGGAGGVDDGADIGGTHVGDAGLHVVLGDRLVAAVVDEDVDGAAVDAQHAGQRFLLGGSAVLGDEVLETLAVLLALPDGEAGAGVLHDPGALGGRGGRSEERRVGKEQGGGGPEQVYEANESRGAR